MILLDRLARWHTQGKITADQYRLLSALERRERFSVFFELNALLYLGVLAFVAGLGWTIKVHFANLGDLAVVGGLSLLLIVCLGYCFSKAPAFSPGEVESPNFVFDYILYLGCLVYTVELGYLENRFHLMEARWDLYLLVSAVLLFLLAYRFDNRFVLSLALSTLAGWFGVKLSHFYQYGQAPLRLYGIAYGALVAAVGFALASQGIKKHFLDTYLQVAAHALMLAALSGVFTLSVPWMIVLGVVAVGVAIYGIRTRQFSFVAYAVVYSYIGISYLIVRLLAESSAIFLYGGVSGIVVIVALIRLSKQFGSEVE